MNVDTICRSSMGVSLVPPWVPHHGRLYLVDPTVLEESDIPKSLRINMSNNLLPTVVLGATVYPEMPKL
jgi:hypothetical protein